MIGWTAVGHDWCIYMARDLETDGKRAVSTVGPLIVHQHRVYARYIQAACTHGKHKVYARDLHWS